MRPTPGSAAGEIGRFAGIPGPVDLAGVFTEGDQILMVLRGAGVCLVRLDADLRILSTTGWDTRFNEDPFAYWRTVELTSGTGLFDLRDPIRYAVAPPGGHPGAIASTGVGFPDVIDSKAVGAAPEGGFLVAWNDSWDIHTAGFASDGGLLGGFHHLTDDGRYPSLMFWRDHSIIGYHGGGVVGPFVNFMEPTGEPSTGRLSLGEHGGVDPRGVALDDGFALTWLGASMVRYALLDDALRVVEGPVFLDGGRIFEHSTAGFGNTLLVAYTVQESVSSSNYSIRWVKVTDHVPSEVHAIDTVQTPRFIYAALLAGRWYVFWTLWLEEAVYYVEVV